MINNHTYVYTIPTTQACIIIHTWLNETRLATLCRLSGLQAISLNTPTSSLNTPNLKTHQPQTSTHRPQNTPTSNLNTPTSKHTDLKPRHTDSATEPGQQVGQGPATLYIHM